MWPGQTMSNAFSRISRRLKGEDFFFEKKKQKTFVHLGFGLPGKAQPRFVKVFWFFFSKKNRFLLPSPKHPDAAPAKVARHATPPLSFAGMSTQRFAP
jgi:hypothetical protein